MPTINKQLPLKYQWLYKETGPKALLEAIRHHGVLEHPGRGSNVNITAWAKEVGGRVADVYLNDGIPWCGLFMAICIKRAGYDLPKDPLWALNWLNFGVSVPKGQGRLGDVACFKRPSGGHVGFIVGENKNNFAILGGNQSDEVTIAWFPKTRCVGIRRPPYKSFVPKQLPQLTFDGQLSSNEA